MPACLTLHFSAAPARELVLPEGCETIVGRDPECGVAVEDDRVSRRHAALRPGPAGWTLTDLGSKNGTLVDGVPVENARLAEQSWISFGGLVARFQAVAGSVEALQEERLRRLTTALEARRALDPSVGLPQLLSRVVASMLSLANAERGFLLLARADGDLEVAARSGLSWDDLQAAEFGGSVGAVERALSGGQPVVSSDARADALLGSRASVVAGGIRALLCVPVLVHDRRIGVLYADSRKPGAAFTELDLDILEALAAQAGLAIAVRCLDDELRQLAEQISHDTGDGDAGLRARLARQITEILDRSLSLPGGDRQPADRPSPSPGSWNGLLAAHASLGSPS
ncbi:MAG: GAF domain-containing protein [Thermoanaerobaculia bacterium]